MFLVDGFRSIIAMAALPGVFLREKEVTPIGYEGGGGIETTTMRNAPNGLPVNPGQAVMSTRTFAPKSLITISEMDFTAQYDPFVLGQILAVVNIIQLFTITFPDGATAAVYGWLDVFKPQALKEGDFPLASCKIIPTGTVPGSGGNVVPSTPVVVAGSQPGVLAR